jgi:hypothetical protein
MMAADGKRYPVVVGMGKGETMVGEPILGTVSEKKAELQDTIHFANNFGIPRPILSGERVDNPDDKAAALDQFLGQKGISKASKQAAGYSVVEMQLLGADRLLAGSPYAMPSETGEHTYTIFSIQDTNQGSPTYGQITLMVEMNNGKAVAMGNSQSKKMAALALDPPVDGGDGFYHFNLGGAPMLSIQSGTSTEQVVEMTIPGVTGRMKLARRQRNNTEFVVTPTAPTLDNTQVAPTGEKFDAQIWASMSAADRTKAIDALPATSPDGYTKGNESTVKDNLVKYYDPKSGKAVEAYDLLTGKFETMQAAGIAEFPMKSGGVYEMESFISSDPGSIEAANSMLEQAIVVDGVKYGIGVANSSINLLKFLSSLRSIDGFAPNAFTDATFSVPNGGYMEYAAFDLDGGTVFLFVSKTNQPKVKYLSGVSPADFVNNLNSGTYTIPAKPTN